MLKVGPHVCTHPDGLAEWLAAGVTSRKDCAVFPLDDPRGALWIGRAPNTDHLSPDGDPVETARSWWRERIEPVARANPHIKVWEGSNENAWSYDWPIERMQSALRWYGDFDYELGRLMRQAGLRPCLGGWAVTTPGRTGVDGKNVNDLWGHYSRGLDAIVEFGGIFHRHCYGPLDETYALRHRADHRAFEALGYVDVPMNLSEVGAEACGGMQPFAKQFGGDPARYVAEWIEPFEVAIRADDYVLGANLFALGDSGGWADYNVASRKPDGVPQRMAALSAKFGPIVQRVLSPRKVVAAGRDLRVTAPDGLRLRQAPVNGLVILVMGYGEVVQYDGAEQGGWLRVRRGGVVGWASAAYLVDVPKVVVKPYKVNAARGLYLRASAIKTAAPLALMPNGSPVKVQGQPDGEYWPITYGTANVSGWASRFYLVPDTAPVVEPTKPVAVSGMQAIADLAPQYGIHPAVAMAVLRIESGGTAFAADGRMIVRLEAHILSRYLPWGTFARYFAYGVGGLAAWVGDGHRVRTGPAAPWTVYHGKQATEWAALTLARGLSEEAALLSTSLGAAQVMGFNHKAVGYASALEMHDAFTVSGHAQVKAMLDYCKHRGLVPALQRGDFLAFATGYNGTEQAARYARLMAQAAKLNGWTG